MPRIFSFKVALLVLFLFMIEVSVLPVHALESPRPVLTYLFVLYVGFEWHWKKTLPAALLIGILRDGVTLQPLGAETVALLIASLGFNLYVQKVQAGWMPA